MARGLWLLWMLFMVLLVELQGELEDGERGEERANIPDQPRMLSDNGHLVFSPGNSKDICFKPSAFGRVKVGEEDLTLLITQIKSNKADIEDIKANGGAVPPDVTNKLNQLSTKVTTLESKVSTLELTVQKVWCSSNPCQNGGTCLNLLSSFHCLCPSNWGGPNCGTDVNECQTFAGTLNGCQNGATCVNTPGSFSCSCPPEWSGSFCTQRYDDCRGAAQDLCVHGTCIDADRVTPGQPRYQCICESGWNSPAGNPACVADVDECSLPNKPCSSNPPVDCFNTQGSFYCGTCPAGWQGNGYSCQDVDECRSNNGGCSTSPLVQCLNTMGSFHCGPCPPGYQGDGRTCTQSNICDTNNGGCYPLATCSSTPGSSLPICTCPPGYTGNGYGPSGCTQTSNICQTNNPCVNGQCVSTSTSPGYQCNCSPGWAGVHCDQNMDECSSSPCLNSGTCVDQINGFSCTCPSEWTGPLCQTPQQECGGFLTGPAGSFSYPNNPGHEEYDHMVSCAWVIRAEPNKILHITFPYFELETSYNCNADFLQIHDGDSASAYMIGRYCGRNNPNAVSSSHNALYFWFRSDHSVKAGGFTVVWQSQDPVCGDELTAPYGSINSPGYPGNYPPSRDCYWSVSVNPGLLITFAFGVLSLETHPDCNFDYLEVRDGLLPEDPLLARYCSTSSPAPVVTTGPNAWIHFHSDGSVSDRGFHITYTTSPSDPGCGGTFTDTEGIIISPNWPNDYAHNRQCVYIIRLPQGEKVSLNFTHMNLESHSSCAFDYVEVRDGLLETAPLIGRYCGSILPALLQSSSSALWIRFRSDSSVSRAGFRAMYSVACGGVLSSTGQLRSPLHPNAYPHNKVCEWVISQPQGYVVTLNFLSFSVEGGTCRYDSVEVRDGSSSSAPLLGTFCGTQIPPRLQSTQTSLYVRFQTDSSVSNLGFLADYGRAIEGCGATLTRPNGVIVSPGHPNSYPHGANCTWFISVAPGNIIRLTFDSFNMEYHSNCNFDYVELYDNGTVESGTKLGRFCGRSVPPSVTSTDSLLTLLFVSDSSLSTEGFSARYVSINATTDCSESFTSSTGSFFSPNYPSYYPSGRDCFFTITVQVNLQIMLNFTDFELEGSTPSCNFDFVEIRDGGYESSPLIGKWCGTNRPPVLVSHSNRLWVRFRSDATVTRRGFTAHWDGTQTGCGGSMSSAFGGFSSPNYPLPYHPNAECYWSLRTSPGSQLLLSFSDFHLESSSSCTFDYLAVYDGNSSSASQLVQLCGSQIPLPIASSKNQLYVKLRTDSIVSAGGFIASYSTNCSGMHIENQHRGVLESLNFPSEYPPNTYCTWTILASSGNNISYSFSAFQLEGSSGSYCSHDYVKLFNGPDSQAPLLGSFCGSIPPPPGRTTTSALTVIFRSDNSVALSGFQMLWSQIGCGGELHGPTGSFYSPGYPDKYPDSRECVWYISTATGSSITITIHEFDVEFHQDCNYDVLEVYGGPDLQAPQLAKLCSTTTSPMQVSSTGNMVTVRFRSDQYVSGRGFNASWVEVPGGCGGPITAPSGEIHSPLYPNSYPNNVDCSWVISVDPNHRVLFNFSDLDIEFHSNCTWDYVEIHDGPSLSSPLLAHVCGSILPSPITSTSNTISVRFRSDSSRNHRGFRAYFSEACGASIMTDNVGGAIASPRYPAPYGSNLNCSWIIKALEPFNHVMLSFTDFELESHPNCSHDALQIRDGDNYQAPVVGRYCGAEVPHPVTSFSNALVVTFLTDHSVSGKGFRATYTASTSGCGGDMVMETGAFNSPNYPDPYPPNVECVWTIRSSPGNHLQLSFTMFSLQGGTDCGSDFLEIREGNSTGLLVGCFCGNTLPSNYTSLVGHVLWIKFVSDGAVSGAGFRATFSHLYGNDVSGEQGQIASPLYPRTYPMNAHYQWTITVDGDSQVEVRFLDIDIEDLYECYYDHLKMFDGPSVHFYPLGMYCGLRLPPPVRSSGSTITLLFESDTVMGGRGFLIEWRAVQNSGPPPTIPPGACGGSLTTGDRPGFLFSPGWPQNYPHEEECTWLIRSPDSTVELNLLYLDMEDYPNCYFDSLVIRDGSSSLSPILATVCGREVPGPLHSSADSMYIHFSSDSSVSGRGFNASYSRGCGGLLHSDRGILSSPLYPQNYRPNADCSWHIQVTPGFRVSVAFQSPFQIQGFSTDCSTGDYLELHNGQDMSAPLLARLCGASPPALLQTTDNHLHLRFKSDSSNEASGFKLIFEAHSQACGGHIQLHDGDVPGYITSPGYPQNYPQNIDCVWVITVPNGEAVQLDFQDDFYIEHTTNCLYDYLEVRDGSDSSADLLSRLCGNTLPSTQCSTGSSMTLRFRTDTSVTHKGFKAQYSISTCGGRFIGQSGLIHSPGFPGSNYPDGSQCEWYLEGPTGHYLTLRFQNLSLSSSSGCSQDYVEIREYNASGLVLGRHCGSTLPTPMDTSDSFAYVKFVSDASGNAPGFSLVFEASVEVCGGELNAPSGTISSPNYPNLYPHSRLCRWEVVAVPGRRVTLTINDLRLEGSGTSCVYDYVEVLNGLAANAPRLQRFCGSVPAGTQVRSSGNTMTVVFRTDASVSNGGFSTTYSTDEPAVCGGILGSASGGNITSPGYPLSNYSSNLNCEWLIQNHHHINSSIVVLIQDLHLQSHQTCAKDYLQFRLGDANGEQLAKFCGQSIPPVPIVVFTPQLYVHFQTDSSQGDQGFRAQYSFSECGGWQMGEGGQISSPNYPAVYPGPSRCAWLLEAPAGHTITLTFSYFNLEPHTTCSWDSVTIFNGGSPGSPVIGQYCGISSPGTVQSGSNKLAVVFLADHSVSRGGFVATWSADSSGCGGVIHAESGTIKSPNYPQNFPANSECLWHIIAHEGNHLEMNFSPDFQIPDSSGTCSSSYVKVWSGRGQNSDLLSSSCGSVAPQPVVAPRNLLTVRFQTTGVTAKGFSASFSTRCGANFTATRGSVVSPNYPSDYPLRTDCNYTIDAGEQTVVVLTFRVFQVEAHSSCSYDGLKVYSLLSGGPPIATVCGSTIPGPFHTLGPMRLNFYSDSVVSDAGFMAEYSAFACGGFFNSSSGTISSPAHSITDYLHNINCSYHIMVQDNRVIDLKFNQFDLEASSSCRYDYVAVYDGPNTWAPLLGTFCGSELPPNLRSSSNNLYLVFRTDSSVSSEGWRATYSQTLGPAQGCGGYLSMPMGMLGSPDVDLDGRYEPLLHCIWTIEQPINRAVNLSFSSFELESSSTCRYDYLKIYDGDSGYWPLVGTLCGNSIPSFFVSSGNFLTLEFKTDNSVQKAGFNATYMSVPLACGGVLNATTAVQTLTSPSFPQPYPAFTSCRWVLDAPPQETIRVAVQIFVFQPSQSCSTNYLEMKDWPQGDYGQSHRFCAEDAHPPDFYSIGRTIHVNFKSDAYMTGNGLSFTYQIAGCSRIYEQEYGFLKSPGWPNIYPHNQDCTIILRAPANHIISFFFNSFNMESHPQCSFDYLEVRNGSTADAPLLGKFCGSTVPSPVFPQSNQLYLRFKSDYSHALDGFEATWTSSPHGCGGPLYGDHGSFASPNFPGTYPNGTHCEWVVSAPRGRVVTVTFAQISIDDEGSCERNYLKLYNGPDASSPLVGAYCGTETDIAPYTSSSHQVYFVFEAQSATLLSGFRLTWSS